jgi:hypothetical protein
MGRESAVDTYSATQDRSSCSYTLSRPVYVDKRLQVTSTDGGFSLP